MIPNVTSGFQLTKQGKAPHNFLTNLHSKLSGLHNFIAIHRNTKINKVVP